jgi:hypothetical protein
MVKLLGGFLQLLSVNVTEGSVKEHTLDLLVLFYHSFPPSFIIILYLCINCVPCST